MKVVASLTSRNCYVNLSVIVRALSPEKGCLTSYYSRNVSFGTNVLWGKTKRFIQRSNLKLNFQDGGRPPYWILWKLVKIGILLQIIQFAIDILKYLLKVHEGVKAVNLYLEIGHFENPRWPPAAILKNSKTTLNRYF